MPFVGTFEHAIDSKSRLAIPADVRQQLEASSQRALYCVFIEGPTLAIYTEPGLARRAEELDRSARSPDEIDHYERMFYSTASRVELDKQGRIRIPERMLQRAGLGREVVVLGVNDHLEIRDRDAWNRKLEQELSQPSVWKNPRSMR